MASSEKQTEWFLSRLDGQGRVTVDSDIRTLYGLAHRDMVWVKIKKVESS